jgi:hypothetical protein
MALANLPSGVKGIVVSTDPYFGRIGDSLIQQLNTLSGISVVYPLQDYSTPRYKNPVSAGYCSGPYLGGLNASPRSAYWRLGEKAGLFLTNGTATVSNWLPQMNKWDDM